MARKPRKLTIGYSEAATNSLEEIREWNAHQYGHARADRYINFILDQIDLLETEYLKGQHVPVRLEFQYIIIMRKPRGHGHVVVYRVTEDAVEVVDIFHTAQDWQRHIARYEQTE